MLGGLVEMNVGKREIQSEEISQSRISGKTDELIVRAMRYSMRPFQEIEDRDRW